MAGIQTSTELTRHRGPSGNSRLVFGSSVSVSVDIVHWLETVMSPWTCSMRERAYLRHQGRRSLAGVERQHGISQVKSGGADGALMDHSGGRNLCWRKRGIVHR